MSENDVVIVAEMNEKRNPCSLEIFPRNTLLIRCNLLRCPAGDHSAALLSAAGAHINDIICISDHIQIMFNDEHSRPVIDQRLKYAK